MFVTSDIFDLRAIGRFRGFDWQENLLGGVAFHGTSWRGYQADAAFLLEAARRCGVSEEMRWAGYSRSGDERTRPLKPSSFGRLVRGELAGALTAEDLLLRGERLAPGSRDGTILFGGSTSGGARVVRTASGPRPAPNYPYRAFDGDFVYPIEQRPLELAADLLRLSVEMLDAEYGYWFVRDDLCQPWLYTSGISPALDAGQLAGREGKESGAWRDFVSAGGLWTEGWPMLRDLYQINLLSERHASVRTEHLGYLTEWIEADTGRGTLEPIGRGRVLWRLTDAEILDVRPLLIDAGLLMSRLERVYRDLTPGSGVKPSASPWCYAPR